MSNIVQVSNLTKYYGKKLGIENVTFFMNEGEVYGLMGPNGAGKTTSLRAMLNLILPTSGEAIIFGKHFKELNKAELSQISYLPGEFEMYQNLTGEQYLNYISSLRSATVNNTNILAERLDLNLNSKIKTLSKGNKQKIGIIQAFMNNPKLAILDEPTSGLDPLKQQEFQNIVQEQNNLGCSVLLSSHILGEIEDLCERVGIIKNGNIVASEQISDLKNKTIKKYEITFENAPKISDFKNVENISKLELQGNTITLNIKGTIDILLKVISKFTVLNLRIIEPSLEEIFLTFYKE